MILYLLQYYNTDSYIGRSTDFISTDRELVEKKLDELEAKAEKGHVSKFSDAEPEDEGYEIVEVNIKEGKLIKLY